jgi:hypothetical protein
MEIYGKSALIAIAGLMASAIMVAAGVVVLPSYEPGVAPEPVVAALPAAAPRPASPRPDPVATTPRDMPRDMPRPLQPKPPKLPRESDRPGPAPEPEIPRKSEPEAAKEQVETASLAEPSVPAVGRLALALPSPPGTAVSPPPPAAAPTRERFETVVPLPDPPVLVPRPAPLPRTKPGPPAQARVNGQSDRTRSAPVGVNGAVNGSAHQLGKAEDGILPPWRRFAALSPTDDGRPMVAIVLDDLGLNRRRMQRVIALTKPLTLAFLPYADNPGEMALAARQAGHEILLHLPMEPTSPDEDPGPNALLTSLGQPELVRRIEWSLARFDGYVGVNNHMGSRFTAREALMSPLMARLKARGLLFLDSLTTNASVGRDLARRYGVPVAARDIFIDNEIQTESIKAQLKRVERCAWRKGHCIAIGHPHRKTLKALERWLPALEGKGISLVPLTAIISRRLTG